MIKSTTNNDDSTHSAESSDKATRNRIGCELDKNFMVEAAAGTGKTTSIVNRLVSLVAQGICQIEQLAAVTFTRKAAAELRERFQLELRRRAASHSVSTPDERAIRDRLLYASDNSSRAFVGTIHSFCAALLRERPIEFGVDPSFREIDEKEDLQLREQAWLENISDLIATGDPLLDKLDELGLDRLQIKQRFNSFIEHRDVSHWPHVNVAAPGTSASSVSPHDSVSSRATAPENVGVEGQAVPALSLTVETYQTQTLNYIAHMRKLLPLFPITRGTDKLMDRYESIVRSSGKDWNRLGNFFNLLDKFNSSHGATQKYWYDKSVAKAETQRWDDFRETTAKPGMQHWCRVRYQFVVDFLRRAVAVYERLKLATGGLDFNDLLLTTARGLKAHPELRKYFQSRYTHLLVDEFQDTDPIQAEMILYLASADVNEREWQKCNPRPGSLFLVGDPKQSIYRFRRGDILTYNRVKEIFKDSGGEVLALTKNFRSCTELLQWNNVLYRNKFLAQADNYTPAAEDMLQGRENADSNKSDESFFGIYRLNVDSDVNIDDATQLEADSIARFIRHAIDSGKSVPRTKREIELGRTHAVEARDFLIIPWGKKRIGMFRSALEAHGIPCEVTGGNAFGEIKELGLLIDCLRAIDDPHNPVHYLAVLRDGLFGFSDRELYRFKQAGGRFVFTAPVPDALDTELKSRFVDATERFKRYQTWLRALPFTAAVSCVAEDLGLLASAAAGREGNVTTGGLLKAIEWLRQQSFDFDSASDLISFFEGLLETDESEGCTALSPDANVVRVMNLHKAKGLEAPIVFLADTSMKYVHPVLCHIDRSGKEAVGYMGITAENGKWATKDVATPENWQKFQAEEQRFLDAEADRLLYVATTRAACAMIVSVGKDNSNWSGLYPYLNSAPAIEIPTDQQLQYASRTLHAKPDPQSAPSSNEQITTRWKEAAQPNYATATAKELGLKGISRPRWATTGDYGYQWGSAVHELLEICTNCHKNHAKSDVHEDLRSSAITLANEYHLGSERVEELLNTVRSATQSQIWNRAQLALRCFAELPFEALINTDGLPTILRGVIDLIFEEPATRASTAGWVIVDYKTDDITDVDLPEAVRYYQSQLRQYAYHWTQSTGFPTKELGLYFTRLDRYVVVQ